MTADLLKYYMLVYWKMRGYEMAATEVSIGNKKCDVVAYNNKNVVEVEVKITMGDMKKELVEYLKDSRDREYRSTKWIKHHFYADPAGIGPNYFYFCVPETMESKALEFLNKDWITDTGKPRYGLITISDETVARHYRDIPKGMIRVVQRSAKLRENISDRIVQSVRRRAAWELLDLRRDKLNSGYNAGNREGGNMKRIMNRILKLMEPGKSYTYKDIDDHFTNDKIDIELIIDVGVELGYIEEIPADFYSNNPTFKITKLD